MGHTPQTVHDVLVIGSGAAGLTAALTLAEHATVLVLAKGELTSGSTAWAQGGIAAVLDAGDTFEEHIRDTMVAGAGLNRRETVEFVIERAPHAIAPCASASPSPDANQPMREARVDGACCTSIASSAFSTSNPSAASDLATTSLTAAMSPRSWMPYSPKWSADTFVTTATRASSATSPRRSRPPRAVSSTAACTRASRSTVRAPTGPE